MSAVRPRLTPGVLLLLGGLCAREVSVPAVSAAAVIGSAIVVRADGRAFVEGGRVDTAYQRALEETFRRGLLEALRLLAPERQSPHDLEIWQETILSRAGDFVGAWRILAQEERDGFLNLSAEIEIYRDKLARAAHGTGVVTAAAPVRVLVLAGTLPLDDRADGEELDAGRPARVALESELSRRGAIIVATTDPAPWEQSSGPSSEENRVALAAAVGKKLSADAVLLVKLTRRGGTLVLDAQLVATSSETTLAAARAEIQVPGELPLAEAFAQAARQVAAVCTPRLAAARSAAGGGALPRSR